MHDSTTTLSVNHPPDDTSCQAAFATLLPTVERHARRAFRHLRCPQTRADAVAEAVALVWRRFLLLLGRGQDAAALIGRLVQGACRHVRAGRRLCGEGQARPGCAVASLPDAGASNRGAFEEALRFNTRSPVPDQVAFRLDFRRWRGRQSERDRRIADDLMRGEKAHAVARAHGLSPASVARLRRRLRDDWQRFQGETAATPAPAHA